MTKRRCKTCRAKGNESVKRSRAFLNIEAKLVGAHLGKGNRSISSSERPLFRLFDFFGAFLLHLETVELEGAGLGFPALFLLFASSAELSSE